MADGAGFEGVWIGGDDGVAIGLPEEKCLPLISNFAEKMWAD